MSHIKISRDIDGTQSEVHIQLGNIPPGNDPTFSLETSIPVWLVIIDFLLAALPSLHDTAHMVSQRGFVDIQIEISPESVSD